MGLGIGGSKRTEVLFVTVDELKKLIQTGEKADVEFKKAENGLNKDIYESVCSFNNRNGGHLILGVVDDTKEIIGVNPQKSIRCLRILLRPLIMRIKLIRRCISCRRYLT